MRGVRRRYATRELAAYSYDKGQNPYADNPSLLQPFAFTAAPNVPYVLQLGMEATGLSTFTLFDGATGAFIEAQYVQHATTCVEDSNNMFNEGTVQGLYFGGTCAAPTDVVVVYG